jgi:hypothetical protein
VRDTIIRNCTAPIVSSSSGSGGGVYVSWVDAPASFVNCVILDCVSQGAGGGLYYAGDQQLLLSHCRILGNAATGGGGGGIVAQDTVNGGGCTLRMDDCLVAGNSSSKGGGVFFWATTVGTGTASWILTNCTVAQNSASLEGGAFHLAGSGSFIQSPLEIYDTIAWSNSAPIGPTLSHSGGLALVEVTYCDIQGGASSIVLGEGSTLSYGPGNLDLDPLFADPDGPDNNPLTYLDNDYRLAAGSPCTDAGDNALVGPDLADIDGDGDITEPTPLDLLKQLRFVEDPSAPNTGQGTPPLVDLGALERQP